MTGARSRCATALPRHDSAAGNADRHGAGLGVSRSADARCRSRFPRPAGARRCRTAGSRCGATWSAGGVERDRLRHGWCVDSADLDLRTIQLITPAVALKGRLALVGTLEGPWKNVTFRGRLPAPGRRPAGHLRRRYRPARYPRRDAALRYRSQLRAAGARRDPAELSRHSDPGAAARQCTAARLDRAVLRQHRAAEGGGCVHRLRHDRAGNAA